MIHSHHKCSLQVLKSTTTKFPQSSAPMFVFLFLYYSITTISHGYTSLGFHIYGMYGFFNSNFHEGKHFELTKNLLNVHESKECTINKNQLFRDFFLSVLGFYRIDKYY